MDSDNTRPSHPAHSTRLSRRSMLKAGAATAACAATGLLAPAPQVRAAGGPRKLVIVLASGGWDPTYALDPKPGLAGVDVPAGDVQLFGNLPVFTDASRPAVTRFFTRHADRVAVLNGLQVRSFVHPDCLKRVLTGSPSETAPDMGAVVAYEQARGLPVPYLALGGQARSGPLAAITGRTGTTNQLAALIDPAGAYPGPGDLLPARGLEASDAERALVRDYLDAGATRLRATRGQRGYNARRLDDFVDALQRADSLRAFAGRAGLGNRDYTLDLQVQIPLAARALSEGLSHSVLLQTNDWDTHQDNARQGALHEGLFASLEYLLDTFDAAGLSDDTLFLVLSEMGRTPRLNGEAGKDHWPVTSAMLFGGGVRGGRTFGASNDGLDARSVDLHTGEPADDGVQLQAANLAAGIYRALGVDHQQYLPGTEPFDAFLG